MTQKLTKKQAEVLAEYEKSGYNKRATARKMGLNYSTVNEHLSLIENKGLAPWRMAGAVNSDTRKIGKVTTHWKDGKIHNEWVRTEPLFEEMQGMVDEMIKRAKGKSRVKVCKKTKLHRDDILGEMAIFDAHVGMYADREETNDESYDLNIACNRMIETARRMAARFDNPHKMVVAFGGDMLHADNRSNQTEHSGNILDVDTRFAKVAEQAEAAMIQVIEIAAQVSPEVEVVVVEGNHSWHSEIWMARILNAYFRNNPKINVTLQKSDRKHLVFGENLLVWSHGDRVKMDKWQGVIATEFAPQWGQTKHRHLKLGHIHHKKKQNATRVAIPNGDTWLEVQGLLVEHLSALCPSDSWHAKSGYIGSKRAISGFEYHRKYGLQTRFIQHCG